MLKILCIVDKEDTALDRLAQGVAKYHDNLDYKVLPIHPKRPDDKQLADFEREAADTDIFDFQYFRSATMLLERYPWLKDKKLILTHNNAYSHKEQNWDDFDFLCAANPTIAKELEAQTGRKVKHIPLATDPTFWDFNQDWQPTKRVIMVANRIEAKKGILEVAIACGDLGLTFVLVGAISDRMYFESILQTGSVEFHEQISDEALRDLYYGAAVHVCNSVDGFESGTLPILEAMQCGTPVLTRAVGHVPELSNGGNMVILDGPPSDVQGIQAKLENMLNDKKALEPLRQAAWKTASAYNLERRAYAYQRLYRRAMSKAEPVSVIVPICDKPEIIRACLNAVATQDYPNIELIVCDDAATDNSNPALVREYAATVGFPVRYVDSWILYDDMYLEQSDYGLARARNKGIIYATSDILVFCDQRQIMTPTAVSEFVANLAEKTWLFGDKGGNKTNFIENFSCISRGEIVEAGMFNERCDAYGSMSQELRGRFRAQGFTLQYCESAKAVPMGKSSNKNRKKQDIIKSKNWLWKVGL